VCVRAVLKDERRPYSVVALRDSKSRLLYTAPSPTLDLSQEEIGRLSGLSRQNTNRALRELAEAGLLMIEYRAINDAVIANHWRNAKRRGTLTGTLIVMFETMFCRQTG
jgi:Crp-like helix-turn-helix domain